MVKKKQAARKTGGSGRRWPAILLGLLAAGSLAVLFIMPACKDSKEAGVKARQGYEKGKELAGEGLEKGVEAAKQGLEKSKEAAQDFKQGWQEEGKKTTPEAAPKK